MKKKTRIARIRTYEARADDIFRFAAGIRMHILNIRMNVNMNASVKKYALAAFLAVFVIGSVFVVWTAVQITDGQATGVAEKKGQYRLISAREAREMLDKNSGAILLDVRTAAEFRERRIPRAVLLPHNEIQARAAKMLPDKNALILIYMGIYLTQVTRKATGNGHGRLPGEHDGF